MNEEIAQEILDELFSSLQTLETQSAALLQFLKEKGMAKEEDLAPYFEQAKTASAIRWRASRVRIEHLLAGAAKAAEREAKQEKEGPETKAVTGSPVPANPDPEAIPDRGSIQQGQELAKDEQTAADPTTKPEDRSEGQPAPARKPQPQAETASPNSTPMPVQGTDRPKSGDPPTNPDTADTAA